MKIFVLVIGGVIGHLYIKSAITLSYNYVCRYNVMIIIESLKKFFSLCL